MYLLTFEWDPTFLLHHVAAGSIFACVYGHGRGGVIVLVGLSWGEMTNWLQSSWQCARAINKDGWVATVLAKVFCVTFCTVRSIPMPYYIMSSAYVLVAQPIRPYLVPTWTRYLWAVMFTATVVGGVLWMKALVKGCFKKRGSRRGDGDGDDNTANIAPELPSVAAAVAASKAASTKPQSMPATNVASYDNGPAQAGEGIERPKTA